MPKGKGTAEERAHHREVARLEAEKYAHAAEAAEAKEALLQKEILALKAQISAAVPVTVNVQGGGGSTKSQEDAESTALNAMETHMLELFLDFESSGRKFPSISPDNGRVLFEKMVDNLKGLYTPVECSAKDFLDQFGSKHQKTFFVKYLNAYVFNPGAVTMPEVLAAPKADDGGATTAPNAGETKQDLSMDTIMSTTKMMKLAVINKDPAVMGKYFVDIANEIVCYKYTGSGLSFVGDRRKNLFAATKLLVLYMSESMDAGSHSALLNDIITADNPDWINISKVFGLLQVDAHMLANLSKVSLQNSHVAMSSDQLQRALDGAATKAEAKKVLKLDTVLSGMHLLARFVGGFIKNGSLWENAISKFLSSFKKYYDSLEEGMIDGFDTNSMFFMRFVDVYLEYFYAVVVPNLSKPALVQCANPLSLAGMTLLSEMRNDDNAYVVSALRAFSHRIKDAAQASSELKMAKLQRDFSLLAAGGGGSGGGAKNKKKNVTSLSKKKVTFEEPDAGLYDYNMLSAERDMGPVQHGPGKAMVTIKVPGGGAVEIPWCNIHKMGKGGWGINTNLHQPGAAFAGMKPGFVCTRSTTSFNGTVAGSDDPVLVSCCFKKGAKGQVQPGSYWVHSFE